MKRDNPLTKGLALRHMLHITGRLRDGNEVTLLKNGTEAYPEMLEAIASGTRHVHMESYIFASDKTGWKFAEALAAKAREGVPVRLMVDGLGSMDTEVQIFDYLRAAGVGVVVYRPLAPWLPGAGLMRRDHRKILVVDGRLGFTGGLNVGNDYAPREEGGQGWRDTHVKVEGPAVHDLEVLFMITWRKSGGDAEVLKSLRSSLKTAGHKSVVVQHNSLRRARRRIRNTYRYAINQASETIFIANAYFLPDRGILRSLSRACKRGVKVVLLVAGKSDVPAVYYATCNLYTRLLKSGVTLLEWKGEVMHSKCAVIDAHWSTVGSYNIDYLSLLYNLEVSLTVLDEAFGDEMVRMFEADRASCREVKLYEWEKRPWWRKLFERFFYLFKRWL